MRAALAIFGATVLAVTACVTATTRVEQGETFNTGDPAYDEFFRAVQETRADAQHARADEESAREVLTRALALSAHVDADDVVDAAGDRAKKLKTSGTLLHLQITPEPKMIAFKSGAAADEADLVKAMEEAAKSSLAVSKKLSALQEHAIELEKRRAELSMRTKQTFRTVPRVRLHEIEQELDASRGVISGAAEESERYAGVASKFVLDLARAVETGGEAASSASALAAASASAAPQAPPPRPGRPAPPPMAKHPAAAARAQTAPPPHAVAPAAAPKPAAATTPAAVPATTKKKSGDDFEP